MAIRTGPTGYAFTALRIIQLTLTCILVGSAASLCARINKTPAPHQPPAPLAAVIVGAILGIYLLVTLALHVFGVVIRYIISTVLDLVACVGFIVISVFIGKPLTGLSCGEVKEWGRGVKNLDKVISGYGSDMSYPIPSTLQLPTLPSSFGGVPGLAALGATAGEVIAKLGDYKQWVGRSWFWCRIMKVVWACGIANAILMVASAAVAWRIWKRVQGIPWLREEDDEDLGMRGGVSVPEVVQRGDLGGAGVGRGRDGERENF